MIDLDDITFMASGLQRPECVLTHESGLLFAADWAGAGGVAVISPDGEVRRIEADRPVRPNGIALEPGGGEKSRCPHHRSLSPRCDATAETPLDRLHPIR